MYMDIFYSIQGLCKTAVNVLIRLQRYSLISDFPVPKKPFLMAQLTQVKIKYELNIQNYGESPFRKCVLIISLTFSARLTKSDTCKNSTDPDESAHNQLSH